MRAWENRPDTCVVDEPFYAFYLRQSHANHPGAAEIIRHGETDWRRVAARLTGLIPNGRRIFYQKQMTHHLLPEIDRSWLKKVRNCFLIRDPAEVIASYIKKNDHPALEDLGFVQQAEIFEYICRSTGSVPPVLDASDVLRDPKGLLELLCHSVGVGFSHSMLSWPPGRRLSDGLWATYWYAEVERSTSFQPLRKRVIELPEKLHEIHERCREIYDRLYRHRLH